MQLPLTIKEKLYVTEEIKLLGVYTDENLNFAGTWPRFFRGVLFKKETDQTRPEVQFCRGKIVLSETALRICIFFKFFELPSDSFSLFGSFFTKTTYFYNFTE